MSTKERRRLAVLDQVKAGKMTQQAAAQTLEVSYRQMRRVYQRFLKQGDQGLIHGLRRRTGNRGTDSETRTQAVELYRKHYADFGCTLACEYLARDHDLQVDDQTLRRWLTDAGLWRRRRRSAKKRRRRPRKDCFGELVQIDGSDHDWFEGRRDSCVLMVMIDDATGWTLARFFEGETTVAAMTIFRQWSLLHGLARELYPDRASIYRVNTKAADEIEARGGQRPLTQFGRAMSELDVKLTCAKSPQAKGRVERMNGTLQDRLVKALRVAGIDDLASANAFLDETFLPDLNARFTVEAASDADLHLSTDQEVLDAALCVKETRQVGQDHCVSWHGVVMQLSLPRRMRSLAGRMLTVQQGLDGEPTVHWQGQALSWEAAARGKGQRCPPSLAARVASHKGPAKPGADHPWHGVGKSKVPLVEARCATGSAAPPPSLRQPQPAG